MRQYIITMILERFPRYEEINHDTCMCEFTGDEDIREIKIYLNSLTDKQLLESFENQCSQIYR